MDYNDHYSYENSRYIENTQNLTNGSVYLDDRYTQPPSGGLSIASMVLGILSITFCCMIGGILGIIGTILGIIALAKKKRYSGMAITGLVTSLLGIVINIVIIMCLISMYRFTNTMVSSFSQAFSPDNFDELFRNYDPDWADDFDELFRDYGYEMPDDFEDLFRDYDYDAPDDFDNLFRDYDYDAPDDFDNLFRDYDNYIY